MNWNCFFKGHKWSQWEFHGIHLERECLRCGKIQPYARDAYGEIMKKLEKRKTFCEVCYEELMELYCTSNICESCCESNKCPSSKTCAYKHPEFVGKSLGEREQIIREKSNAY